MAKKLVQCNPPVSMYESKKLFFSFSPHPHTSNLTKHSQTASGYTDIWTCRPIRNKETTFLHKPPARLFSDSTFDHWRLDGLGTGPITSKWNIEFPFAKPSPFFKGGGIFKCSPACQVVYILLLGNLSMLKLRTMDTVWPESGVNLEKNSVALHKLYNV